MPKKSIYFPDEVLPLIGNPHSYSKRLTSIIQRYDKMVLEFAPVLPAEDWLLLCRVLEWKRLDNYPVSFLSADLLAAGEEGVVLNSVLSAYGSTELLALLEIVFRYWNCTDNSLSGEERLKATGVYISPV